MTELPPAVTLGKESMSDKQETAADVAARLLPCDCGEHFAPLAEFASDECPASWRPDVAEAIEAAAGREREEIASRFEFLANLCSLSAEQERYRELAKWVRARGKA